MKDDTILNDHVDEKRWKDAQSWERNHWINAQRERAKKGKNLIWKVLSWFGIVPKFRGDDWNGWWAEKFENYRFLPERVGYGLEVGCGPYTNMRVVEEKCAVDRMYLSDPLIKDYLGFKMTYLVDKYRNRKCIIDDHPIEELPYRDEMFDLVIMNNVLDHVRDARACMQNVHRVLKPGGIFILGQDLCSDEDAEVLKADAGLIGHPIKLDAAWFDPYLQSYNDLIRKVLPRNEGREPESHYGTLIYAGRKIG
jgi:SAM-dependent methyltransferase